MCLAIPAKVQEKTGFNLAVVDVMGVKRTISLDLTPDAEVNDWVLMHAGFAIERIDEAFAQETLELLTSLPLDESDTPETAPPIPLQAGEGVQNENKDAPITTATGTAATASKGTP
jgi:hydrogenase expression/formation protein HypC